MIAEKLDSGGELADVTGQQVLDRETYEEVAEEVEELTEDVALLEAHHLELLAELEEVVCEEE